VDGRRFDEIARHLAIRSSRRGVLGAVAATAAWLVAPRSVVGACPPDQVWTSRNRCLCRSTGRPPTSKGCLCRAASTYCQGGTTCCGRDGCVDLLTDPQHCGACGNPVATDRAEVCCAGIVTQLGSLTSCSTCGDDCRILGASAACCLTANGFACVSDGCVTPTSTTTATGTGTGTATGTGTHTSSTSMTI
jgi:hypothetical protein